MPDRRSFLLGSLAMAGASSPARASNLESAPLWPGPAPGGEAVAVQERVIPRTPGGDPTDTAFLNVTRPILMLRRPVRPNGAAVLMIPGGSLQRVAVRRDGGPIDTWLAAQGYATFVMTYRLPGDGWAAGPDAPLQDAQRALRVIRGRAAELGFKTDRVVALGFSAGGYVAARLGTRFGAPAYAPQDGADAHSSRPDAVGLISPVISVRRPIANEPSRRALVGEAPDEARLRYASVDENVPPDAPPTFIATAADDEVVPAGNSLAMFHALQAQKVTSELHVFERGGHGLGPEPGSDQAAWQPLLGAFLRRRGL